MNIHTIDVFDGSAALAQADRLKVGMLTGLAVPAAAIGDEVTFAVAFDGPLPTSYNVHVTPNGPCFIAVADKTNTGFNVTLSPAAGQALGASMVDILVTA